jgi:hypothetical protein
MGTFRERDREGLERGQGEKILSKMVKALGHGDFKGNYVNKFRKFQVTRNLKVLNSFFDFF